MAFGRKKQVPDAQAQDEVLEQAAGEAGAALDDAVAQDPDDTGTAGFDRSNGPFDADEVDHSSGYADFGALLVPGVQGTSVRLEADPGTGQLVAMTLLLGEAAVQARVLAAPRSGGVWEERRDALAQQIESTGGRAANVEGPFGPELHAMVTIPQGQPGGPGLRPMRFVGVEGPRWLLHAAFMAAGADPAAWDPINDLFRQLVVVRGQEAMPVGAMLAFRAPAPQQVDEQQAEEPGDSPTLESLEPQDRITEVR